MNPKANLLHLISITLVIGFGTYSCKKKDYTQASGKIINVITKQPVDSVQVWICDGLPIAGSNSRENCNSNLNYSDGSFNIEINSGDVTLFFTKPGYNYVNYIGGDIGITSIPSGENENLIFEIEPKCMFDPVYVNTQGKMNDTLITNIGQNYRFKHTFHMAYDREYRGKGPFQRGHYPDWLLFVGDMHTVYKLKYTRNGVWEEKIDSVFIAQGQIYQDTIWY